MPCHEERSPCGNTNLKNAGPGISQVATASWLPWLLFALPGGVVASALGVTAPYWAGFVVAAMVSAATWRVFNRATVAEAHAD
jgi:hypothetical protein